MYELLAKLLIQYEQTFYTALLLKVSVGNTCG
jgi:hypothetical protein